MPDTYRASEPASHEATRVSAEALPRLVPSVLPASIATLSALLVTPGIHALVDGTEEASRYEVGVYASQV